MEEGISLGVVKVPQNKPKTNQAKIKRDYLREKPVGHWVHYVLAVVAMSVWLAAALFQPG